MKLAKYQVKAKQHPEAEYLLFENICFHALFNWGCTINDNENEAENGK